MKKFRYILAWLALALPAFGYNISTLTFTVINTGQNTSLTNGALWGFGLNTTEPPNPYVHQANFEFLPRTNGQQYYTPIPAIPPGGSYTFVRSMTNAVDLGNVFPTPVNFRINLDCPGSGQFYSPWITNFIQQTYGGPVEIPGAFYVNFDLCTISYSLDSLNFYVAHAGDSQANRVFYPANDTTWTSGAYRIVQTNSVWRIYYGNTILYTTISNNPLAAWRTVSGPAPAPKVTLVSQPANSNSIFLATNSFGAYWTNPPASKTIGTINGQANAVTALTETTSNAIVGNTLYLRTNYSAGGGGTTPPTLLTISNSYILPEPQGTFAAGDKQVYYVTPSSTNRNFSVTNTIHIPSDSGITFPKLLTTNKLTIVQIQYSGSFWMLTSLVGEY